MPRSWSRTFPLVVGDAKEPPSRSEEDGGKGHDDPEHVQVVCSMAMGREQFQQVVTPLIPQLYRLSLALTGAPDQAEDLVQASLIKAYLRRSTFEGRGSLIAWLTSIVRHEHTENVRKTARRRALFQAARERFDDLWDSLSSNAPPDPESWTCSREVASHLLQCVHGLAEPYRTIIWLCDVEELGYDEVSSMLEIPIGTVKSRHARGRSRLRRALRHHGGMDD